jgi:hypothetical protein
MNRSMPWAWLKIEPVLGEGVIFSVKMQNTQKIPKIYTQPHIA